MSLTSAFIGRLRDNHKSREGLVLNLESLLYRLLIRGNLSTSQHEARFVRIVGQNDIAGNSFWRSSDGRYRACPRSMEIYYSTPCAPASTSRRCCAK
jgi:hypothetical protein